MPTTSRGYPYPDLSGAPNVPADIQALAVALNADLSILGDTGWITPTLGTGWSVAAVTPQYRRLNGAVYFQGRAASTGATSVAFAVPAGFCPSVNLVFLAENSGASMRCQMSSAGVMSQIVAAAASSLSFNSCAPYPAA